MNYLKSSPIFNIYIVLCVIFFIQSPISLIYSQKVNIEGKLDLNNHRIINVATPEDGKDAATKNYVDSLFNITLDSLLISFAIDNPDSTGIQTLLNQGYSMIDLQAVGFDTIDFVIYGLFDSLYQDSSSFISLINAGVGIQELLDAGARPYDMYAGNIGLDSIYGKFYEGGLIFFLDTLNEFLCFEGLVASPIPYSIYHPLIGSYITKTVIFPCYGYQTQYDILNSSMGAGKILNYSTRGNYDCYTSQVNQANSLFRHVLSWNYNGYKDWYVPSYYELVEVHDQLHMNGHGNYIDLQPYMSATERALEQKYEALAVRFNPFESLFFFKENDMYPVIPIRKFGKPDFGCGNFE